MLAPYITKSLTLQHVTRDPTRPRASSIRSGHAFPSGSARPHTHPGPHEPESRSRHETAPEAASAPGHASRGPAPRPANAPSTTLCLSTLPPRCSSSSETRQLFILLGPRASEPLRSRGPASSSRCASPERDVLPLHNDLLINLTRSSVDGNGGSQGSVYFIRVRHLDFTHASPSERGRSDPDSLGRGSGGGSGKG